MVGGEVVELRVPHGAGGDAGVHEEHGRMRRVAGDVVGEPRSGNGDDGHALTVGAAPA